MRRYFFKRRITYAMALLVLTMGMVLTAQAQQETCSDSLENVFREGTRAYKDGRYEQAVDSFQNIITCGHESGNVYYNLGNAYCKMGRYAYALLNYEKAKRLIPWDSDLKSNIAYVQTTLGVDTGRFYPSRSMRIIAFLFASVPEGALAVALAVLFSLVCIATGVALSYVPFRRHAPVGIVSLALILCVVIVGFVQKRAYYTRGAILVSKNAPVLFEPRDGATVYFELPEGAYVMVLERGQGWSKVRRADRKIGWIKNAAIGFLSP